MNNSPFCKKEEIVCDLMKLAQIAEAGESQGSE